MPLDFKRATDLFMGQEEELVRALRIDAAALRQHRSRPAGAPPALIEALADVLEERGLAMVRVAEMLREEASDGQHGGNGRSRSPSP
jgi:hypothetical protein